MEHMWVLISLSEAIGCTESVTHGQCELARPSQSQSVTAVWPAPSYYTAW